MQQAAQQQQQQLLPTSPRLREERRRGRRRRGNSSNRGSRSTPRALREQYPRQSPSPPPPSPRTVTTTVTAPRLPQQQQQQQQQVDYTFPQGPWKQDNIRGKYSNTQLPHGQYHILPANTVYGVQQGARPHLQLVPWVWQPSLQAQWLQHHRSNKNHNRPHRREVHDSTNRGSRGWPRLVGWCWPRLVGCRGSSAGAARARGNCGRDEATASQEQ